MNTVAARPTTFVKLRQDGAYDYGYCVRVGKRDRLEPVGSDADWETAERLALALPARA